MPPANQAVAEAAGENGQPGPPAAGVDRQARRQELLRRAQAVAQQLQAQGLAQNLPPGVGQFIPPGIGQGGLAQGIGQFFPKGIGQGIPTGFGQGTGQNWQALAQRYAQRFGQRIPIFGQGIGQGFGGGLGLGRTGVAPINPGLRSDVIGGGGLRLR